MSHFVHSLDRQRKELLLSHYINTNSPITVPSEIIRICFTFFDSTIYWDFNKEQIIGLMNCKHRHVLYGPQVKLNGIVFQNTLCPNGWKEKAKGYIVMYLETPIIPKIVKSITVYMELQCKQNMYSHRSCFTFKRGITAKGWPNNLQLHEFANMESLNFECYFDILRIEYFENDFLCHYSKPISMRRHLTYKWTLTQSQLTKCQSACVGERVCSHNIDNDCWYLKLMPNGTKARTEGCAVLALKLLALPPKISEIEAHCLLECDCGIIKWENTKLFSYRNGRNHWPYGIMKTQQFLNVSSISFCVTINLKNVFDLQGKAIDSSLWSDYGIDVQG